VVRTRLYSSNKLWYILEPTYGTQGDKHSVRTLNQSGGFYSCDVCWVADEF